jgi:GNAT superfamily N-acetyltransferase
MHKIEKVSLESIPLIQKLSGEIWRKVYPTMISIDQIDFMQNLMYSTESLENQIINLNHTFIILSWETNPVGFASYSIKSPEEPTTFRLNKLYLQPEFHGKGLGKAMIQYIINETTPLGAAHLELNVFKRNPTIDFYKNYGFIISAEIVVEIGHGYLLDDYIMTLDLNQ